MQLFSFSVTSFILMMEVSLCVRKLMSTWQEPIHIFSELGTLSLPGEPQEQQPIVVVNVCIIDICIFYKYMSVLIAVAE